MGFSPARLGSSIWVTSETAIWQSFPGVLQCRAFRETPFLNTVPQGRVKLGQDASPGLDLERRQRRATEEADWANDILCRPFRDSILSPHLPGTSCRALDCSVPYGTRCVASIGLFRSWAAPKLFNLNGEIEVSKKPIWTSMAELSPCMTTSTSVTLPKIKQAYRSTGPVPQGRDNPRARHGSAG